MKDIDQNLWAMVIVVFAVAGIIATIGSYNRERSSETQEVQIEQIYIEEAHIDFEPEELPEIVFEDPIILPPLYEPALPQLQGEV